MDRIEAGHIAVVAFLLLPNTSRIVTFARQRMRVENGRNALLLSPAIGYSLLGATVWLLATGADIRASDLGLATLLSGWALVLGVLVGCLALAAHILWWQVRPPSHSTEPSLRYWVLPALLSPFVEELWRALALSALLSRGVFYAVSTTSLAFAVAHARSTAVFVSSAAFAVVLALLFVSTESVAAPIYAHLALNLGLLSIARRQARP